MAQVLTKPAQSELLLQRLTALHPKLIDLSLDRMRRLLDRLGNPERHLPPVVHIAGTNGKGSLAAYLRAMLEAAGLRAHVYTSPHLVEFNERIRLAGRLIDDQHLIALLETVERCNQGEPITFFEATTAAAFLAFAEQPADALVLETGMGGRLDATNVVARPALTAITPISLDHQDFLGNSLEAIAGEKAGILKPGVLAVIGPQTAEATAVLTARAATVGASLFRHGADWQVEVRDGRLHWQDADGALTLPLPALIGPHQIGNAGTAIACARRLTGIALPVDALAAGMTQVEWPARMQRLRRGPLSDALAAARGPATELWLDGGHNPAAGEVLAASIGQWQRLDRDTIGAARPLALIVGMKSNKDLGGFLAPLAAAILPVLPAAELFGAAIPADTQCHSAAAIAATAASLGFQATPVASVTVAVAAISGRTYALPPRILICGSLYFAGTILRDNG